MTIDEIRHEIVKIQCISLWEHGVRNYARDLLINNIFLHDCYEFEGNAKDRELLMRGAKDWYEYSWSGRALKYDKEIALLLCDSEHLHRYKHGALKPSATEDWKDVQARALAYAEGLILLIVGKHDSPARKGCANNG